MLAVIFTGLSLFFFQHFVSERKYDEDLGKAVRFTFDLEPLKTSISGFGSGKDSCSSFISFPAGVSTTLHLNDVEKLVHIH